MVYLPTYPFPPLPVGLWPLTVTFKAPVVQYPAHWTFSLGWLSFVVAVIATMKLQLPSLIGAACAHQQSEKTADPRLEPRSKRCRQLTIRGMISIVIIAIIASSVANGGSTTENTLLLRLMIIDEHFQFYRRR